MPLLNGPNRSTGTKVGITVNLVYSPKARVVQQWELALELGATLGDVLQLCAVLVPLSTAQIDALEWGVWGRKVAPNHVLRDGDRVELYRALLVDPKVARRARFVRQGAKTAGLFSKRRAGAKAGY
jgi:putative ubiquitin-RnfH superfamily antitoxin RatB of RatAB toxin-antitoxin module